MRDKLYEKKHSLTEPIKGELIITMKINLKYNYWELEQILMFFGQHLNQ